MRSYHTQTTLTAWLATALIAAGATCHPENWALDIGLVRQGEWWRLVTGHLVHLSWQHYFSDVLALGLGLFLCRYLGGRASDLAIAVFASAMAVSALVMVVQPVDVYGGLSGITAGLIAWAALRSVAGGSPVIGALLLAGILGKIWLERKGLSVSGVFPVWQVHGAGAAMGLLMVPVSRLKQLMNQSLYVGRRAS